MVETGFGDVFPEELLRVKAGGGVFKAVRGEYGSGKTVFARWLQERTKKIGFASRGERRWCHPPSIGEVILARGGTVYYIRCHAPDAAVAR